MADESMTPGDIEQRLRAGLAELVATAPDPGSREVELDHRESEYRSSLMRRREFLVGAAATTAVAGVGLTWLLAGRDDGTGPKRVIVQPTSTTSTTPPLPPHGWSHIGPAPLSPRRAPAVVWVGDRLIVWGGTAVHGPDYLLPPDGASWDPVSGSWTPIAPAGAGIIQRGFAVSDGREVFVGLTEVDAGAPWNSAANGFSALYGIAVYEVAGDRWRYLVPVPPDVDDRLGSARQAVLVGDSLLVAVRNALPAASSHENDAFFVNVNTGERRELDPGPFAASPYPDASGEVALTVVGDFVVATPNWDLRPWVLDPGASTWRQVITAPGRGTYSFLPATAAGTRAIFVENSNAQQLWLFDPASDDADAWRASAPNPYPRARWYYPPVWSGRELFVPGAAYDPNGDSWRAVEPPPRGKDRQRSPEALWTGDSLLLFGGEEYHCPDIAICDRSAGPDTLDGWVLANP
jgi:hypothetical protein